MNPASINLRINEIFFSIQGEGYWVGTPAVFIRFSGCNRECSFCDTNHELFEEMSVEQITRKVLSYPCQRVVITGGEPTMQKEGLHALCLSLAAAKVTVHLETNGDEPIDPSDVDWLTVSPKGPEWAQRIGDELKVVYTGQSKEELDQYLVRSQYTYFGHYFLQPNDNQNVKETVARVMESTTWRLSLQVHKLIGVR